MNPIIFNIHQMLVFISNVRGVLVVLLYRLASATGISSEFAGNSVVDLCIFPTLYHFFGNVHHFMENAISYLFADRLEGN